MPPVRTEKKNSVAKAAPSRGLAAFGFTPAPKEEVVAAAARVKPSVVSQPAAVQVTQVVQEEQKAQETQEASKSESRLPTPPVVSRPAEDQEAQVVQEAQEAPEVQEAAKPKPRLPKPVVKGVKRASFEDSRHHWDGMYHKIIGTSTRRIIFGRAFKLAE